MPHSWTKPQLRIRAKWMKIGKQKFPRPGKAREWNAKLQWLKGAGFLCPFEQRAAEAQAALDGLGYGGEDHDFFFMLQAHLFGAWMPLLRFHPELASEIARKKRPFLALAVTEKESGSDTYAMRSRARVARGGGWVLHGKKTFVTNAQLASDLLVFAKPDGAAHPEELSCFLVPASAPGLRITPMAPRMGLSGALAAEVELTRVRVPERRLVGGLRGGAEVFRHAMAWERSMILSSAPGRLAKLKEELVFAADKKQRGGGPLSKLPEFREKVRRVEVCVELIREIIAGSAHELDAGNHARIRAMATKVHASRLYEEASRILLQLGGKEAFMAGSPIETNFRDSLASALYSGPNDVLEQFLKKL